MHIITVSLAELSFETRDGISPNPNHTTNDGIKVISEMKCRFLFRKKRSSLMAVKVTMTHTHTHTPQKQRKRNAEAII